MSGRKIRVQFEVDEAVLARIEALGLVLPEAKVALSPRDRRNCLFDQVLMSGLKAEEARRDAVQPPPAEAPTPRTDVPTWMREPTAGPAAAPDGKEKP